MSRERRGLPGLAWLMPLGALAGEGVLSLAWPGADPAGAASVAALAVGAGAPVALRAIRRRGDRQRQLRRGARENVRALARAAREDPIAAPQARRLIGLQEGLLESWELLPEEFRPLLDDDMFTVVEEIREATRLVRRRAALRRHLESADRRELARRVEDLERDISSLEEGSPLRASFESALAGRREELAARKELLDGISAINARLEGVESLLGGLRGELLALDGSSPGVPDRPDLARLKERISYFRRSLDEVTRPVDPAQRLINGADIR